MNNCKVTKLMGEYNIENPEYLGFAKMYVQNPNDTALGIKCYTKNGRTDYFPVGSFIDGEGVFSTGKKIVENGDQAEIPANSAFYVYVPKYKYFYVGKGLPSDNDNGRNSNIIYDFGDFDFTLTDGDISTNGTGTLIFGPTVDGHHYSGNFEKIVPYISSSTTYLRIIDGDIQLNLDTSKLYEKCALKTIFKFYKSASVIGNIESFISKHIQYRKTEALSATGEMSISIYQSGIISTYCEENIDASIRVVFNASSTVTIIQNGVTKATYDINSDTWSAA